MPRADLRDGYTREARSQPWRIDRSKRSGSGASCALVWARSMRKFTKEHAVIAAWAGERAATPARVRGAPGVLRLSFGAVAPNWEAIGWDQFFAEFDAGSLVFMYESTPGSRICKMVRAELAEP